MRIVEELVEIWPNEVCDTSIYTTLDSQAHNTMATDL